MNKVPKNLRAGLYENKSNGNVIEVLPFRLGSPVEDVKVRIVCDGQLGKITGQILDSKKIKWDRFTYTTCCLWKKHPVFCSCPTH